jgi:hypothetical protein
LSDMRRERRVRNFCGPQGNVTR